MTRLSARDLIEAVTDPGTYQSWDVPVDQPGLAPDYRAELERAQLRAGTDEAVLTGRAAIRGHAAALVVSEFGFLGGSIGTATAARITAAIRRATAERLPLIAAPCSGGTRMQEGTPAFVQMVEISRAVVAHKAAGLPYLVYLRNPTVGGVFASWASLGHVTAAEPGALIGFLGPLVYQTLHGEPFPDGVQTAENLVAKGIVDAVIPTGELAGVAARVLGLLSVSEPRTPPPPPPLAETVAGDAWSSVELTRRRDRPGVRELLRYAAGDFLPLSGTQSGETGHALLLGLTSFSGQSCVLVGQDRVAQAHRRPLGPAELRIARRGMRLAQELRLPLVCVIDTPGADLSVAAEEGALAGEIARCIAEMVQLTVPSVSVLLGEGTGGGALALLPSARVIAAGNAWLAPLPPEGASAILFGTADHAPQMAARQRVRAGDLLADGIVDAVVPETGPAQEDPAAFVRAVVEECLRQIDRQLADGRDSLLPGREVGGGRGLLLRLDHGEAVGQRLADDAVGVAAQDEARRRRLGAGAGDDGGGHSRRVARRDGGAVLEHGVDGGGRGAGVGREPGTDLGAAVAEPGPRAAGLDDRDADAERGDLLAHRLGEPLDAPLGGVVHRPAGERGLAAVGGELDDPAAALGPQVRQGRADQLDRAGQVGRDDVVDLVVGQLLGRAEQAVAGVIDDDVDPPELGERPGDDRLDAGHVDYVEGRGPELVTVLAGQVIDRSGLPDRAGYPVAALEQLLGQVPAEAAVDPGDEPRALSHEDPLPRTACRPFPSS